MVEEPAVPGESQTGKPVAAAVTQQANDKEQLVPMLEQVQEMTGRRPQQATADAGYFNEKSVSDPWLEGIDRLVAPDRQKHKEKGPSIVRWKERRSEANVHPPGTLTDD